MNWHDSYDEETMAMVLGVRKFLAHEVPAVYETHEPEGKFPEALLKKLAEMGLFGLTIPEKYGGMGKGALMASLVARELAYAWGALHLIWSANSSLSAFPIIHSGSEEQKQKYLPRLARGELFGCYALTEPEAGSDAASITTHAEKIGNQWVLNGSKTFITNALHASFAIVFVKTGKEKHAISAFILESNEPGLKIPGVTVRKIEKRTLRSSDFCEIAFENVVLPEDALLGELHEGWKIAMATLDGGRVNIAAQAVGLAARVFDDALDYVKLRSQFGRTVWKNQAVQFDFADAFTGLQAAWSMIERISNMAERGEMASYMASATKLFATETSRTVAFKIADYNGGMLMTAETDCLARAMDLVPTTIYEGASNIQRMVIARALEEKNR